MPLHKYLQFAKSYFNNYIIFEGYINKAYSNIAFDNPHKFIYQVVMPNKAFTPTPTPHKGTPHTVPPTAQDVTYDYGEPSESSQPDTAHQRTHQSHTKYQLA